MENIKDLKKQGYTYHEFDMADKINELVDRVNKLSKPVEITKEQPTEWIVKVDRKKLCDKKLCACYRPELFGATGVTQCDSNSATLTDEPGYDTFGG